MSSKARARTSSRGASRSSDTSGCMWYVYREWASGASRTSSGRRSTRSTARSSRTRSRGLTDGTLDREAFQFYVVQDALYLVDCVTALALCPPQGARPDQETILLFSRGHATGRDRGGAHAARGRSSANSGSRRRTFCDAARADEPRLHQLLLAVAHGGSFAEALGALLPCYWIYWEVGKELIGRGSPDPALPALDRHLRRRGVRRGRPRRARPDRPDRRRSRRSRARRR